MKKLRFTESQIVSLLKQDTAGAFEAEVLYDDDYDVDRIDIVQLNNDGIVDYALFSYDDRRSNFILSQQDSTYIEKALNSFQNTLTLVGDLNLDASEEIIATKPKIVGKKKFFIIYY